jgi:cell division septation protein DedD
MATDDGFREIQLNGKQLVFLFMATTIVAVVIFLCGVMVGRGVRTATATAAAEPAPAVPMPDAAPSADGQLPTASAAGADKGSSPAALPRTPPTPPAEDLSDLEGNRPPSEKLQKADPAGGEPARRAGQGGTSSAPGTTSPPAVQPPVKQAGVEPAGEGWVVQVAALGNQAEADAIVRRLQSKRYAVYLLPPSPGGNVYKVRVGKFKERREAEAIMRRLEKEEHFKPWITR